MTTYHRTTDQKGNRGHTRDGTSNRACCAAGTRILTTAGETAAGRLSPGDQVITEQDGERVTGTVRAIGRRRIAVAAHLDPVTVAPILVEAGAIDDNQPHRDLLIAPDQLAFVDGLLVRARQLLNGATIRQLNGVTSVEYVQVALDMHALLFAEGLPVGSFLDRQDGLHRPPVSEPVDVHSVWQRLADRATALGRPIPAQLTTRDPELCVLMGQEVVRPLQVRDRSHMFLLPPHRTDVRLISRAGAPNATRPWLEDRRRLGVCVEQISVSQGREDTTIPLNHPDLSRGWWAIERDGVTKHRWTNGDANLPLPDSDTPILLHVLISDNDMEYAIGDRRHAAA